MFSSVNVLLFLFLNSTASESSLTSTLVSVEKKLWLGDRHYISSVLESVFGPIDPQEDLISKNGRDFGGPCDFYNFETKDDPALPDKKIWAEGGCFNETESVRAAIIPLSTVAREAYLKRQCEKLSSNDSHLALALSKVTKKNWNVAELSSIAVPHLVDIKEVHRMFYSVKPLPEDSVLGSLQDLALAASEKYGALEAWRFIFLTECLSPGWQIP